MRSPSCRPCAAATPDCRPARAGPRRVEFEYRRGGTLAYFAAYDVHHAQVFGQMRPQDRDRAVHRRWSTR